MEVLTTLLSLALVSTPAADTVPKSASPALAPVSAPLAQESQRTGVTRNGTQPSRKGPAENFTGSVRIDPLFQANAPTRASGAYVTFEPGARTAWHTHPLGQVLVVTAGVGRVQRWGETIEEIRPGDVRAADSEPRRAMRCQPRTRWLRATRLGRTAQRN